MLGGAWIGSASRRAAAIAVVLIAALAGSAVAAFPDDAPNDPNYDPAEDPGEQHD